MSNLLKSTYVDDVVTGAEPEGAAYELYKASKGLLKSARFNLRKFTSNSSLPRDRIEKRRRKSLPRHPSQSALIHLCNLRRSPDASLRRAENTG